MRGPFCPATSAGGRGCRDWTPRDRLRMFPEDIEYLLCKSLASGDSLSWIESFSPGSFDRSASQKRFAGLIRQYEELRLADSFPAATRRRLAEPDRDFTLEPVGDGDWQFRPVAFDRHAVTGANDGSCVWKTRNPFTEQPLQVRIEAGLSLALVRTNPGGRRWRTSRTRRCTATGSRARRPRSPLPPLRLRRIAASAASVCRPEADPRPAPTPGSWPRAASPPRSISPARFRGLGAWRRPGRGTELPLEGPRERLHGTR